MIIFVTSPIGPSGSGMGANELEFGSWIDRLIRLVDWFLILMGFGFLQPMEVVRSV